MPRVSRRRLAAGPLPSSASATAPTSASSLPAAAVPSPPPQSSSFPHLSSLSSVRRTLFRSNTASSSNNPTDPPSQPLPTFQRQRTMTNSTSTTTATTTAAASTTAASLRIPASISTNTAPAIIPPPPITTATITSSTPLSATLFRDTSVAMAMPSSDILVRDPSTNRPLLSGPSRRDILATTDPDGDHRYLDEHPEDDYQELDAQRQMQYYRRLQQFARQAAMRPHPHAPSCHAMDLESEVMDGSNQQQKFLPSQPGPDDLLCVPNHNRSMRPLPSGGMVRSPGTHNLLELTNRGSSEEADEAERVDTSEYEEHTQDEEQHRDHDVHDHGLHHLNSSSIQNRKPQPCIPQQSADAFDRCGSLTADRRTYLNSTYRDYILAFPYHNLDDDKVRRLLQLQSTANNGVSSRQARIEQQALLDAQFNFYKTSLADLRDELASEMHAKLESLEADAWMFGDCVDQVNEDGLVSL